MQKHLFSRSENTVAACGRDAYLHTHNVKDATCGICIRVAKKRKVRKNYCANCAGRILVQIFKGTGACSVDCQKVLEKDAV